MDALKRKNRVNPNASLADKLAALNQQEQEILAEKDMLIEKSLRQPTSPRDVVYATNLLKRREVGGGVKSYLLDPINSNDLGGFRNRPFGDVSYSTMRAMAKQTGIISAIIGTRKEQVAAYSGYSTDELQPGWSIVKNVTDYFGDEAEFEEQKKLTVDDKEDIKKLISFIENGGMKDRMYHSDDFNVFLRKFVEDSLTLDQACFEIVPSEFGTPYEFLMVDGATIRFCDAEIENEAEEIKGYYPFACQIYQNSIYTTYYPWELCMGIRNPTTNFLYQNYGVGELELLIKIITYMLFAEGYTGKFFSQGSNPKGVFLAKGNLSEDKLAEFRQAWTAQVSGVNNAHKIPILSGTELEWVDWYKSNQDMEFSNWLTYLARLICSVYKIDPREIGYNIDADGAGVNYESSVQEKLTYSKEKGLIPLLQFIEDKINHYLIFPISNKKYKFQFTGVDNTQQLIEENDLKKVEKGVMSFQEYRAKHGLPTELEENDFLLNSTWIQYKQMQMGQGGMGMSGMPGMSGIPYQQQNQNSNSNTSVFSSFVDDNPFVRDLEAYAVEKGYK